MERIGKLTRLTLGRVGEEKSRKVQVDFSEWTEKWPGCVIAAICFQPDADGFPQREELYIPATEMDEAGILTWLVRYGELTRPGRGIVQFRCYTWEDGEDGKRLATLRESRVVETIIHKSVPVADEEDAPQASAAWVNNVITNAQNAEYWAKQAEAAAGSATLESGSMYRMDINGAGHLMLDVIGWGTYTFVLENGHLYIYNAESITNIDFAEEQSF